MMPRFGWLYRRPYEVPKRCRWCNQTMRLVGDKKRPEHIGIGCVDCDRVEGWPRVRTT